MNNIEILEQLEKMQQTFMEDGLQGYEMAIVTAKNLINRLIQENKELKEKLQQYKKIEEIVNTITDDDIRNAIKNAEKDYIPKSKVKEKIEELQEEFKYLGNDNKRVNKMTIEILQELLKKENNMSEEEIIGNINWAIHVNEMTKSINGDNTHISVNVLQGLLDLYNKEKEKREIAEENHKVLCLDLGQALKDLGLPEDTIIADELVLEINKKYISKDKFKDKFKEKIDFLKEVLAFAETGRDEKATIQANLLKNIIIEMEKLLEE